MEPVNIVATVLTALVIGVLFNGLCVYESVKHPSEASAGLFVMNLVLLAVAAFTIYNLALP